MLEECRRIATEKTGRVRSCRLQPDRLSQAQAWLAAFVETRMNEDDEP